MKKYALVAVVAVVAVVVGALAFVLDQVHTTAVAERRVICMPLAKAIDNGQGLDSLTIDQALAIVRKTGWSADDYTCLNAALREKAKRTQALYAVPPDDVQKWLETPEGVASVRLNLYLRRLSACLETGNLSGAKANLDLAVQEASHGE